MFFLLLTTYEGLLFHNLHPLVLKLEPQGSFSFNRNQFCVIQVIFHIFVLFSWHCKVYKKLFLFWLGLLYGTEGSMLGPDIWFDSHNKQIIFSENTKPK